MATADELTNRHWKALEKGRSALCLGMRAVYAGYREYGCGRCYSAWQALVWLEQTL